MKSFQPNIGCNKGSTDARGYGVSVTCTLNEQAGWIQWRTGERLKHDRQLTACSESATERTDRCSVLQTREWAGLVTDTYNDSDYVKNT